MSGSSNERLCESCHRFRRLVVAVTCTACDEPILLAELLEQLRDDRGVALFALTRPSTAHPD